MRSFGRRKLFLFLPLLVLSFLSACASVPILPQETPSPEDLLNRVNERLQALQGLKGFAWIKFSSPEKSFSTQEVLFVRRPSSLRLESLSPLGTPQLYVVIIEEEMNIYFPGDNLYYRGESTAGNFSFALPVALTPQEVVPLLLGELPPFGFEKSSLQRDPKEGLWILELANSAKEYQRLWVDPRTFTILRAEFRLRGLSGNLNFSNFQSINNILFPKRILFTSQESQMQLIIEYQEVDINPSWETQDFQLLVPRGAKVMPLG